ncbi:MAG: hypothetical protein JW709_06630 [Sedimentisphaerales bacterium]|nr:hypothetical protein [Sedimentisphaerales bacterium]
MREKDFQNLLQAADESVPIPCIPADLAARVQQRAGKRRRTRIALSIAVVLLVAIGLAAQPWRKSSTATAEDENQIAQVSPDALSPEVQAELDDLQRKIDACNARIEQLLAQQQTQKEMSAQPAAQIFDAAWEVKEQVEYAAFIGYFQAKRKYERLGLKDSAAADLQDVIRIFPDTRAARQARDLLMTLNVTENGASYFINAKSGSVTS